jgi:hypothetical protein
MPRKAGAARLSPCSDPDSHRPCFRTEVRRCQRHLKSFTLALCPRSTRPKAMKLLKMRQVFWAPMVRRGHLSAVRSPRGAPMTLAKTTTPAMIRTLAGGTIPFGSMAGCTELRWLGHLQRHDHLCRWHHGHDHGRGVSGCKRQHLPCAANHRQRRSGGADCQTHSVADADQRGIKQRRHGCHAGGG